MQNNIIEINKKIIKKRNKLHNSIDKGLGEDAIYQASIELDVLIAEYLKNQIQQEQLNKYNDIINTGFRKEILDKIKKDVKNEIKDISDTELEYYCNNIYLYKTIIIIANKVTDVEKLDKIYLMVDGEILSSGTHKELLENNELYREMYNYEMEGEEIG